MNLTCGQCPNAIVCTPASDTSTSCYTNKVLCQFRAILRQVNRIQSVIQVRTSEPYRIGQLQLQLPWTPVRVCTDHSHIAHDSEARMQTRQQKSMDVPTRHWAAFMALALLRYATAGRAIGGIAPAPANVRCCPVVSCVFCLSMSTVECVCRSGKTYPKCGPSKRYVMTPCQAIVSCIRCIRDTTSSCSACFAIHADLRAASRLSFRPV